MAGMTQVYDDVVITLGALAANDVVGVVGKIDSSRENGMKVIDGRFFGQFANKTDGDGPYAWGIACNLGSAEIEAILEQDLQQSSAPTAEGPSSWIKLMGTVGEVVGTSGSIIDGLPFIDQKINWSIPEGSEFTYFVWNFTSAVFTTGQSVLIQAQLNGVWLRD